MYAPVFYFVDAANAQSGALDNSFSKNGKAFYETFTGDCVAMAIQKDGKIVTGGFHYGRASEEGFIIARFNVDGSLDENFADGGIKVISKAENNDVSFLVSLAIQEDDKIIACGHFTAPDRYYDIGIIRLNTNGTFDNSFSGNGILSTSISLTDDAVTDMLLQPDGKILITGKKGSNSEDGSGSNTAFVIRYLTDGNLDAGFGQNGVVLTPVSIAVAQTSAIALQTDNKIIVSGKYFSNSFFLIRYLPDGRIDSTFDEDKDGITGIRLEEDDIQEANIYDLAIQQDGKILTSGTADGGNAMSIIRFNSDGSIDSAFGDKIGYSLLYMAEGGQGKAYHVDVSEDKKILLMGIYYTGLGSGFGAARYNVDGSLDSSFGENGIAVSGFIGIDAGGQTGLLQNDGKILVGGTGAPANDEAVRHIALMRFNNEITLAPPEFAKIKKWQGHYGFTWNDWPGNKTIYYSVGRSSNASTFTEIAQVPDVPNQKKYQFEDPAPPAGIVYYQLTAVRSDDKEISSNIISAGSAFAAVKLFPNPAKNSLRIEGLSATDKTNLTIVDISGNIKVSVTVTGGSHTLNIANLKPGNYMLRMETNGNIVTRVFVKE